VIRVFNLDLFEQFPNFDPAAEFSVKVSPQNGAKSAHVKKKMKGATPRHDSINVRMELI